MTAFYTQGIWLSALISNRIEPLGFEFYAQKVEWYPEWPLRAKAEQVAIYYRDGKEPRELLRGPLIEVEMQGVIWKSNAWQIARLSAHLDQINWAPHRIPKRVQEENSQVHSTESVRLANSFSLMEYQVQLSKMVVYSPSPSMEPVTYLLNLKTPWVRGPFNEWSQIQKGIFPGPIQFSR